MMSIRNAKSLWLNQHLFESLSLYSINVCVTVILVAKHFAPSKATQNSNQFSSVLFCWVLFCIYSVYVQVSSSICHFFFQMNFLAEIYVHIFILWKSDFFFVLLEEISYPRIKLCICIHSGSKQQSIITIITWYSLNRFVNGIWVAKKNTENIHDKVVMRVSFFFENLISYHRTIFECKHFTGGSFWCRKLC